MSADFWAGYLSGAVGILIGNPLDLIKTRLQADPAISATTGGPISAASTPYNLRSHFDHAGTLVRGAAAPIAGYGALNALLFVSYNRTLSFLTSQPYPYPSDSNLPLPSLWKIWTAGAVAGLTTFVVSAPTELIKCRAQVSSQVTSSWAIARDTWKSEGIRGLYYGGGVTSIRDAVGYGFYFWAYEWSKNTLKSPDDTDRDAALKVLLCGGLAGVVTWASIFPLDVIKTRVQTQVTQPPRSPASSPEGRNPSSPLLSHNARGRLSAFAIARQAYRTEGLTVFFRGLGICSVRAFVVNAVQWAVYEWMMEILRVETPSDLHQVAAQSDATLR